MYVCACLSPRLYIKNHSCKNEAEIINQTSSIAFQFLYMILAIDNIDGWALVT